MWNIDIHRTFGGFLVGNLTFKGDWQGQVGDVLSDLVAVTDYGVTYHVPKAIVTFWSVEATNGMVTTEAESMGEIVFRP